MARSMPSQPTFIFRIPVAKPRTTMSPQFCAPEERPGAGVSALLGAHLFPLVHRPTSNHFVTAPPKTVTALIENLNVYVMDFKATSRRFHATAANFDHFFKLNCLNVAN